MARSAHLASAPLLLALLLSGCGDDGAATSETPEDGPEVLARVGDTTITVEDFSNAIAAQSPYLRARFESPQRRRELLENMIRFELLATEARRRGYFESPEVVRARKQAMIEAMMEADLEGEVQLSDVTDEEIREYYEAHPAEFHQPPEVRAGHIVVATAREANAILAELRAAAGDGELFRRIARERSLDDATRELGGDLRFFGADAESPAAAVRDAAWAIEAIGDVAPRAVRTDAGYHVIMLFARRGALARSLEDARRPVQSRLWREKREQAVARLIARLRSEAQIEENLDALRLVRLPEPEPEPEPSPEETAE